MLGLGETVIDKRQVLLAGSLSTALSLACPILRLCSLGSTPKGNLFLVALASFQIQCLLIKAYETWPF